MASLEQAVRRYVDARREAEIADHHAKKLKKDMRAAESTLVEVMLETDTKSIKRDESGLALTATNSFNISVTLGNTEEWLNWLEQRDQERSDYLRETIISKNLRDFARKVYEQEGKIGFEDLPVDDTPIISVRGWKDYMAINSPVETNDG